MANEIQNTRQPSPSGGPSRSGLAAAALGLVALVAAWFAVMVAYGLAQSYDDLDYLEAGLTLGAIASLLLWGAILQMHYAVTGQHPTGNTIVIIALVCFVLMVVAVLVAGELGNSQSTLTMG